MARASANGVPLGFLLNGPTTVARDSACCHLRNSVHSSALSVPFIASTTVAAVDSCVIADQARTLSLGVVKGGICLLPVNRRYLRDVSESSGFNLSSPASSCNGKK